MWGMGVGVVEAQVSALAFCHLPLHSSAPGP